MGFICVFNVPFFGQLHLVASDHKTPTSHTLFVHFSPSTPIHSSLLNPHPLSLFLQPFPPLQQRTIRYISCFQHIFVYTFLLFPTTKKSEPVWLTYSLLVFIDLYLCWDNVANLMLGGNPYSRKSLNFLLLLGCRSFRKAFASICRILSLVT